LARRRVIATQSLSKGKQARRGLRLRDARNVKTLRQLSGNQGKTGAPPL